jgi:putative cardiolipin synthase
MIAKMTAAAKRFLPLVLPVALTTTCFLVAVDVAADQLAILDDPDEAIDGRIHLLNSAEKSIDVLYFSVHDDLVTRATLGILREKALAGINVRIITAAKGFKVGRPLLFHLQSLDTFEIRLYNVPSLTKPLRIFRQLHDKLILVDGDSYITGGRNLGQVYFDTAHKKYKMDRDVYVIGDSARTAAEYFDELWESRFVKPADSAPYTVKQMAPDYCDTVLKVEGARAYNRCVEDYNERISLVNDAIAELREIREHLVNDPDYLAAIEETATDFFTVDSRLVELVHDPVEGGNEHTGNELARLARAADEKILIQTPYVVPTRRLFQILEEKQAEGVPVIFVTNSMKSTVNTLAHAAYLRYRKKMIDLGATFIESTGESMLHAKSMVLRHKDGTCIGGIGSFNIDPRSSKLNTEIYCAVRDCDFAEQLEETIMRYAEGGVVVDSREAIEQAKEVNKEAPFSKRFQIAILRFLTPLYRSQI